MLQKILDRFTGHVLFEAEIEADAGMFEGVRLGLAVKVAFKAGADLGGANLGGANLRGANLRGANLRWADLRWADLRWANLRGANLDGANLGGADLGGADLRGAFWGDGAKWRGSVLVTREPIILSLPDLPYGITILDRHVQIGCRLHEIEAWADFAEADIERMDGERGVRFWRQWRDPLLAVAKAAGRPLPAPAEQEKAT